MAVPLVLAGERAIVARPASAAAAAPQIDKIAASAMRQALAWQERKLVFEETPLREAAAQFNRRNLTQLILADEELGARPVGGVFAADNVAAFVRLLETAGDIVAEPRGGHEIVLRRAR